MRVPIPPQPHQHLLLLMFQILALVIGMQWHLIAVIICISLMTYDVEHFSHANMKDILLPCVYVVKVSVKVFGPF